MVRKTALVTAMLGAFASQAFGMGLGEIRLNSVLNQPLHAEIELLSPTANDLAELQVALASSEDYAKAGVERAFFHTRLRFQVVKRPNGTAAIKITSREAVREPYLDFLIEATWGSGQVLREYTVLVDPPAMMPAPRPSVEAPVTEPLSQTSSSYTPAVERVASGLVDGQYHTQPSDTLWSIATAVRPDGSVSMEQVMLGLLKANPDAFIGNNINNLKAGQILRVPSREELATLTQGDALSEVSRQNAAWRTGRVTDTTPVPAPAVEAASTEAAPPTQATAPEAAPTPEASPDAQLKLTAPEAAAAKAVDTAAGTGQNVDELRKELSLAVESVEAQRQENQELNTRLKSLEDQISQLHRLIELKNTEMAQLGAAAASTTTPNTATAQPETAEPASAAAPTDTTDTPTAAPDAELPAVDTGTATAPPTDAETPAEAAATAPTEPDVAAAETAIAATPEPATPAPTVPAADTPVTTKPAPATKPVAPEETGLIAALLANPMLKWAAAGAAALVALLAWLSARRRRLQDPDFQESILAERKTQPTVTAASVAVPAAAAVTAAAAAGEARADAPPRDSVQSDSSLFTDFAVSDMGTLQNDAEADPVAEADVYLAYGRYQQAEELIRTALSRTPQRNDLKFKLLEVLYAAKNVGGFDAEAESLLASLGSQEDELWQRAKEMGQEMNPGNPLYGSASPVAAAVPVVALADSAVDFAPSAADNSLDFTPAVAPVTDDHSLDFDMGELDAFAPTADTASISMPVEEDFSFDLSAGAGAEDDGDGTLASIDEVATKLDLARAYIEMGDPEGARSILDEVLQEGSGAQQSEAQSLLSHIGDRSIG